MKPLAETLKLSPEQQLLVAAARPVCDPDQIACLRNCCRGFVDWDRLLDLAAWHGLTPLLYRHLTEHCADLLSPEFALELLARYRSNVTFALSALKQLADILQRLNDAGVETISFKGPAQAAQLYGDLTWREFSDLDLLLRPNDAARADVILKAAGYLAAVDVTSEQLAPYMRTECDRLYVHPETGLHLEVHWAMAPPYFGVNLPAEALIGRASAIAVGNAQLKTLSPEDLLLVLVVNGAKEMWEKLEWLCAVGTLLQWKPDLDWALVQSLARKTAGHRMLLIGLGLAAEVFDLALPSWALDAIYHDRRARRLIGQAKAWLFAEHFQGLGLWQITRFRLGSRERARDRWRYGWLRLVTPTHRDLNLVRLPPRLRPLYLLLRPVRLMLRPFRRS